MEKSCFSLAPGLMREALGKSDVGANTRPPWASADESAAIHPIPRAAATARNSSECAREGRQRVHAQVAGDGAVDAVAKERAPSEGKRRHHGKQHEGSRHTGGSADQIAAARDLAFFAGFLTAPRSCLFGLVGLCHRSVASSQLPVVSAQVSKILSEASRALPKRASKKRGQKATAPHRSARPSRFLIEIPTNRTGNCGEAFPIKPSATSANKLATSTGAAICTPATHMPAANWKQRVDRRPGEGKMAGRQIFEAARQSAQHPVWDAELNEEQQHNQFVEDGEHGGIGLAVGIDDAGERIPHLHAADLAGQLPGFEDELEGESEAETRWRIPQAKARPAREREAQPGAWAPAAP